MSSTAPVMPPQASDAAGPLPAIEMHGLTKKYGERFAVRDLNVSIPPGVVAGFVGPNGAGKTTTIRMLLGLVRPTSGSAEVLQHSISHPAAYLPRVGALIEGPAFYASMSGRANLKVLARMGGFPLTRIGELIDVVGLSGRDKDRVGSYSLGMKQRLGVAAALLPNPDLLVLDEPSNGLDPPGIIEMRELMRRLRDEGKTIFVSSHLLNELEQVADWLVVLKEGQSVYTGPTGEIRGAHASGIVVKPERSDQLATLRGLIAAKGLTVTDQGDRLVVVADAMSGADLNRLAAGGGITLAEISIHQATLEETFLTMIQGDGDAA